MASRDSDDLPALASLSGYDAVAWELLKKRFNWYSGQATLSRWGYLACRVTESLLAACITVSGALRFSSWIPAVMGAAILVVEGLQQLLQFHTNYLSYRKTAEALRNEAWLFAAGAGPYVNAGGRGQLLAERITQMSLDENAAWVKAMSQAGGAAKSDTTSAASGPLRG